MMMMIRKLNELKISVLFFCLSRMCNHTTYSAVIRNTLSKQNTQTHTFWANFNMRNGNGDKSNNNNNKTRIDFNVWYNAIRELQQKSRNARDGRAWNSLNATPVKHIRGMNAFFPHVVVSFSEPETMIRVFTRQQNFCHLKSVLLFSLSLLFLFSSFLSFSQLGSLNNALYLF